MDIPNSSYAHQNYVQSEIPSSQDEYRRTLLAARHVIQILDKNLPRSIRWTFRGFIAYKCYVPDDGLYQRYTDDIDIVVDSKDLGTIDEIEKTLLQAAPTFFSKSLSPSNLLKVHYNYEDGSKVRLDIYNTSMNNTGRGNYHGLNISWLKHPQQIAADCPAFDCPVPDLNALIDFKLVAFLDRRQTKDLEDIFFAFWCLRLDRVAGLPWYKENVGEHECLVSGQLHGYFQEHIRTHGLSGMSAEFSANVDYLGGIEGAKEKSQ
ncbi:hypothetical protein GGR52DRAFT_536547 [Hypoxylon sp. FL1284]|nr:hypothetical protein GGR52DRAFT_536547 [Hypoxylon sp. FL1284]